MMERTLSSGKLVLRDTLLSAVFRLMLLRIQLTVGAKPALAYQLESLFMDYHEDMLLLTIRGRFHLKPVRKVMW